MQKNPFALSKNDVAYPPLLRETIDAPEKLFWSGKPLDPQDEYFAIVGTRRPSRHGKQMAEKFAGELAAAGFVIVSGLAYGIDAISHEATLEAHGRTIAVLGAGFNHITPTCNIGLAKRIQKTGTLITEFEIDVTPDKWTFPKRNRIIAGMSLATLVIEAPEKSGALITAYDALDYNRDVFAVPANLDQESSYGTNKLIVKGHAFPITCIQDIFDVLNIDPPREKTQCELPFVPPLTKDEETLYLLIKLAPRSIDELIVETKMSTSHMNATISLLELKRLIKVSGAYAFITR